MMVVWGPGHGAPGVLSGLWLEGSITKFYSHMTMDKPGFDKFVKSFSWPGGFPSHINAETPGQIHEGGELGYALSVAYGAVMDYPDLIAVAVVGDGEAETGPTATAWHAHKFLDPGESGAVLPILHANGFKISERTLMGCADDKELTTLFTGYGYQCAIVDYGDLANETDEADRNMQINLAATMNWAYDEIRKIQSAARSGNPITKPRWPMIVLRSPKGWTGPRTVDGLPVLNSFRAHQVPLMQARTDKGQLQQLKDWLASYKPLELFDPSANNIVKPKTIAILPKDPSKRLGQRKITYDGYQPLNCPEWIPFATKKNQEESPMKAIGRYLAEIVKLNPKTFRIFSPDELRSNKLDQVFEHTTRDMQWDPETAHKGGRVTEMLSEHTLQGFLQGYTLTGRTGLFPSYEAFLGIVTTMIEQFAKFSKVAQTDVKWRGPTSSLNYIDTSTLWRQEHNGYSHQNPGLINSLLDLPHHMVRVYLPPDANCAVSCMAHCLRSKNYVNLIVGSKSPAPNLLTPEQANEHCVAGISTWPQYSTHNGEDPDVVLVGCGNETTTEVLHTVNILKEDLPQLRIRVVNIVDLLALAIPGEHPHALSDASFDSLFTPDKPVIVNFHGYPSAVKTLLFPRGNAANPGRFQISGYIEQGTTTTPMMMLRYNECCRFDVAIKAIQGILKEKKTNKIDVKAHALMAKYMHLNRELEKYAKETGEDPPQYQQAVLHEG
ncbi:D-xylulose 5-phosphate/D-fructose 6-phosphate phosphoketolase [Cystobasidium minutum MCA 4210]|uniref:D-xylulose 5-phosphate/D-fructose 6-phosphate phosphoketolase n=1 Tax=Cystobasidium minutum MCA 4210 TaxID=1397322 RepID=UPI0034CF6747|eukprot:jgi/Rhomi1/71633/CE71632_47632